MRLMPRHETAYIQVSGGTSNLSNICGYKKLEMRWDGVMRISCTGGMLGGTTLRFIFQDLPDYYEYLDVYTTCEIPNEWTSSTSNLECLPLSGDFRY